MLYIDLPAHVLSLLIYLPATHALHLALLLPESIHVLQAELVVQAE